MKKKLVLLIIAFINTFAFSDNSDYISKFHYDSLVPDDYSNIQTAINHSFDGDVILISPGTYYENINFDGKNITITSFFNVEKDSSFIYKTIINGRKKGSVIRFENQEKSSARLSGFTLTNGSGVYDNPFYNPENSSYQIELENPYNNDEHNYLGGGIYCKNANPSLDNLIITNNSAFKGGGIFFYSSNAKLERIIISNNLAEDDGGGVSCYLANPSLKDVNFIKNSAVEQGAGIACLYNSNPSFLRVRFEENKAGKNGGGIFCTLNSNPIFNNTIILKNSAASGGAVYSRKSSPEFENVTIVKNSATKRTAGIFSEDDSNPVLMNCILWKNSNGEIAFSHQFKKSSVTISYSDIYSGLAGITNQFNGILNWDNSNLEFYPLFKDEQNNDYQLMIGSPCINSGNPEKQYDDLDETRNDMGAFGGPKGDIKFWWFK